jgi:hypothetical protein
MNKCLISNNTLIIAKMNSNQHQIDNLIIQKKELMNELQVKGMKM